MVSRVRQDVDVTARDRAPQRPPEARSEARSLAVVTFDLGGHRYGVAAAAVREVYQSATITALPRAPAAIEGVLDVRGTLAPVFDLRSRLGHAPRAPGPDDHLIVADAGERLVVVRVDRVIDLIQVAGGELEVAARLDTGLAHLAGVARTADGLVVIHDLARFLSSEESAQLTAALDAAPPDPALEAG